MGEEELMKIKSKIKASALVDNHNQTVKRSLKVKTSVKAGGLCGIDDPPTGPNNNQTVKRVLKVKTSVKAGGLCGIEDPPTGPNNNQTVKRVLKVKSGVKAGLIGLL